MILRSHSRIIFGLSIADIMRSAEILASSFVDLSDTLDAPWALGTVETCEAAGYFLQVGGTTIPFYTLFFY
jgi:hypothetical protein